MGDWTNPAGANEPITFGAAPYSGPGAIGPANRPANWLTKTANQRAGIVKARISRWRKAKKGKRWSMKKQRYVKAHHHFKRSYRAKNCRRSVRHRGGRTFYKRHVPGTKRCIWVSRRTHPHH